MFKEILKQELRYGFKQPMIYVFIIVMFFFAFMNGIFAEPFGNVLVNAPVENIFYAVVYSMIGVLFAGTYFSHMALKDFENSFDQILFSTNISKSSFFFGRFFAAFILTLIPFIGVYLGSYSSILIGPALGWTQADYFTNIQLNEIPYSYLIIYIPNVFIAGAFIFAIALKTRSQILAFAGALVLYILFVVSGILTSDIENHEIAALADVFGFRTIKYITRYFTPIQKNTILPQFEGVLLYNRLIWIGFGLVITALGYLGFSFKQKRPIKKTSKVRKSATNVSFALPEIKPFDKGYKWAQFWSLFKINLLNILKSPVFIIFSAIILVLMILAFKEGYDYYGLKSLPVTYKVLKTLDQRAGGILIIIIVIISGETVWRNRSVKINEVIDATPHRTITHIIAQGLSAIVAVLLLTLLMSLFGIGYQLINGYTNIALDQYVTNYLIYHLPTYVTWSFIFIFIHTLINQKYIGYFICVLILQFYNLFISKVLKASSNMLYPGASPSIDFSDMSGYGPGLNGALWFELYWISLAFFILTISVLLWSRGSNKSFKERIKSVGTVFRDNNSKLIYFTGAAFLIIGSWVFYNTQILNTYKSKEGLKEWSANYEKKYKKYENIAVLTITDIKYNIDLVPEKRELYYKIDFSLKNKTNQTIDSLHFSYDKDYNQKFNINNSKIALHDEEFDYMIYTLNKPIQPSDSLQFSIEGKYIPKGFTNSVEQVRIATDGTFIGSYNMIPTMGYDSKRELTNKNHRKEFGLPKRTKSPALNNQDDDLRSINYISGNSDLINSETIISTSTDQYAIAPGSLIKRWEQDGRNYFHYKVDHPSYHFSSFLSAKYEIAKRDWNGISLEVYYNKKHGENVPKMLDALQTSLKYYIDNFGPYTHKQARIIEFPNFSSFAQAFPGTMPYSESFGFIADLSDSTKNNVVEKVIAHEMGHQWWAHQEIPAYMKGAEMITEAFAEYSSLMIMKQSNDDMNMQKFLKYECDGYLRGRTFEREKESPLYTTDRQQYIHYQKGSLIMYALQDMIGEDKVNTAMREFLDEYKYKNEGYATSLDFLAHLEKQVPDSLQYLIDDWFKEITLYDHRLNDATIEELPNGRYLVSMDIETQKIKVDTTGNENFVPSNDWVDIGVFADADKKELIHYERVKFDQPKKTFKFEVDQKPLKAMIDPRQILIEKNVKDNVKTLEASL
ncbi:ABC transporter permease/M1 family aminopeptidase [Aureibacter tunicatorum]|uniref:Peptidase M1 membrane alanine aminopeptidase domain-containing protein n=1 Tax=Aureibacter tunicatorum TaxID=866807 RepID=A0AAE3XIR7_9BACT|nr:M1 family aminopeptidase [Aureibacter tunicatorum]MDR6237468.1 hypothetical protein [Aureibacter tunicatorum]BDD06457.1 membrane protein [Aureibacter tunicatorum]